MGVYSIKLVLPGPRSPKESFPTLWQFFDRANQHMIYLLGNEIFDVKNRTWIRSQYRTELDTNTNFAAITLHD